jgi:hypothetical protein
MLKHDIRILPCWLVWSQSPVFSGTQRLRKDKPTSKTCVSWKTNPRRVSPPLTGCLKPSSTIFAHYPKWRILLLMNDKYWAILVRSYLNRLLKNTTKKHSVSFFQNLLAQRLMESVFLVKITVFFHLNSESAGKVGDLEKLCFCCFYFNSHFFDRNRSFWSTLWRHEILIWANLMTSETELDFDTFGLFLAVSGIFS